MAFRASQLYSCTKYKWRDFTTMHGLNMYAQDSVIYRDSQLLGGDTMDLEKQFRLPEASRLSGYSVAALRKKIARRELGHRKTGRIITVPQSDLSRLLGEYRPPVELEGK